MAGVASDVQADFSAGMCPGIAPHLIPRNGAARLTNFLIDEDGSAYKRSGTSVLSPAFGSSGLTFLWDGWLVAGKRTVIANSSDFGVLADDDSSVTNLGGAGLSAPARATEVAGVLFIDGGTMYAGARKATYNTGTVAVTNGSKTVTGTGTSWNANVEKGMFLTVGGVPYVVSTVDSDTQVTIDREFAASTASGQSYTAASLTTASGDIRSGPYAAAGERLISFEGARAYTSAYRNPFVWNAAEDYHEFVDGVQTVGGAQIGDTLMVFTTSGVWSIGNMEQEIVDDFGNLQRPQSQIAKDLTLWSKEGIAGWRDALVVPATDGVWLIGAGQFSMISSSVSPLYREYVRAGHKTGIGTVLEANYLLPILDSGGAFVDLLVCRLDRPIRVRQDRIWPWTRFAGAGAEMAALTTRVGTTTRAPMVLGAELGTGSRVVRFGAFEHDGDANDHDDTPVETDLVMRDISTGRGENTVKKIRMRYELFDDADEEAPVVTAYLGSSARPRQAKWDEAKWDVDLWPAASTDDDGFDPLVGEGGLSSGERDTPWRAGKRVKYVRPRFKQTGSATRFVVREVQVIVRPSGRM